jgi:DNA invertase Pin-like site-specific DNA recombinase
MNGSAKIQAQHRERQAVVYLRQSTPKQVLNNRESAVNQRALCGRLIELGWHKSQIAVVDDDQGKSGTHTGDRAGFQRLVAEVSLRRVGIIMGYEASRLSRNCADWHRLLELCALFDTLIADVDGIYHPRDFNDRLLLGLKGTLSEAELHSIRLRLDAGRLSKAKRGELIQPLPTGLNREPDGKVCFDPDQAVQDRLRLVFSKYLEVGSVRKVLRFFVQQRLKLPRRQIAGRFSGMVLWREPSTYMLLDMLQNPAYAGAFAYGRRQGCTKRSGSDRLTVSRLRHRRGEWLALVQDVYQAYITWETYEAIQLRLTENARSMADQMAKKSEPRRGAALLTGLVRCGRCGGAMSVVYKGGPRARFVYRCNRLTTRHGQPSCQHLSGSPIDDAVVHEFFEALRPAAIDAWEAVRAQEAKHAGDLRRHLLQEVERLRYAAARAERQYDCVDPENRLIARSLEKKWETALAELAEAQGRLTEVDAHRTKSVAVPAELRAAFTDAGRRLPELWPQLSAEARKELLRALVTGVNLKRADNGVVQIRIVWRGGLVSETTARVVISTRRHSAMERSIVARIGELTAQGLRDAAIAERLNQEGCYPCRRAAFNEQAVYNLRYRYGIVLGFAQLRRGVLPDGYTIRAMARLIGVQPWWIYDGIYSGHIRVAKDVFFGCYLFPKTKEAVRQMKLLKLHKIDQVYFTEGHCDG